MKELDVTKMEFLITLNENIVVQRFYNVKGYNPVARASMELYDYVKGLCTTLEHALEMKTVIYMLENQDEIFDDPNILETSNTDGPESFNLYIKIGDETICHRIFDAKLYPPKIRYTLDIRPQVKSILRDLTDIFSGKKFNTTYLNYQLSK
jgi:hypothetical protein